MVNRGRHKIKKYPKECYALEYFNAFKQAFTPKEAELLIQRIKEYSNRRINLQGWERNPTTCTETIGFVWDDTNEGYSYWNLKIQKFIELKIMKNERS